jgi:hypothetical protein
MSRIVPPRKPTYYDDNKGTVVAQEREIEKSDQYEYTRILELVDWNGSASDLRFSYYKRKKGQGDEDWITARKQVNMLPETLVQLIKKANKNPDFRGSLKKIQIL